MKRRALLTLLLLLGLAPPASARPAGTWLPLLSPRRTEAARITFYGPQYGTGDVCASGMAYEADARMVALGPSMLAQARALSGEDWPVVRVCVGDKCHLLPVWDTGAAAHGWELEVDLPDATWQAITGQVPAVGVVEARVDVWCGGEVIQL